MKKVLLAAFLLICVLIISGCGAKTLEPQADSGNQKIMYNQGTPFLVSDLNDTSVALSGMITENNELFFHIAIKNNTQSDLDIVPEKIQVIGYNKKEIEKSIEVYPPQKYYDGIKNAMAWQMFAQALSAAANSSRAGYSTTTYNGSYWGSNSYGNIWGTSTTYDPGKAAQVQAQNQAMLQQTADRNANALANLRRYLLWHNTLTPGMFVEGLVVAKYNASYNIKYKVIVPFGNDMHEVVFLKN